MKKLEPKSAPPKADEPVIESPPVEVVNPDATVRIKPVKEKSDYTWVWILIALLATVATVYFMNIDNAKENGNPETK